MLDRENTQRRENLPNIRGEDESELQALTWMIDGLAWQLTPSPTKAPTCILGRHPKPPSASATYCAAVYTMGKNGTKTLDFGPEMGANRKDALRRLLDVVECEVGRMMVRDARDAR